MYSREYFGGIVAGIGVGGMLIYFAVHNGLPDEYPFLCIILGSLIIVAGAYLGRQKGGKG